MALDFDTSAPLRSPQSVTALVEAIHRADPGSQETHWLECKSTLDFGSKADRFAAARAIIAFANRDPVSAGRDCGGEAYLVVGVAPGQLVGVTEVLDAAALHDKLRPYVDGPQWSVDYFKVEGHDVAVFTVAAPRPGDRIHSLVTTYENNRSGTVFHRGVASSPPATHRELIMLQDRLLKDPPRPLGEQFRDAVEQGNPLVVARLMRATVQQLQAARADPQVFPNTFASRQPVEQLRQYLAMAQSYEELTAPLLDQLITACAWPNADHERIWADTMAALAQPAPLSDTVTGQMRVGATQALIVEGRDDRLQALALLPATLALYAGSISAVQGRNFGALRALTTDATVPWSITHPNLRVTVIERVGPWEALSRDDSLALTLRAAQVAGDDAELEHLLGDIAQHRRRKPPFVASSYLFDALQPHFAGLYGLTRYGELFDETEIMFSLVVADQMAQDRVFTEPWLGLFVTDASHTARLEDSRYGAVLAEVNAAGDDWPPLQAGLFGGSIHRLSAALQRVTEYTEQMRHRVF